MSFNPQKFKKKHEKTLFTNRGRFDITQSFDHKIKLKTYNYTYKLHAIQVNFIMINF